MFIPQGFVLEDEYNQIKSQQIPQGFELEPKEDNRAKITSPVIAAVKAASEFVPGTLFATEYWKQGGPFKKGALGRASEVTSPIEQAQVKGIPAQVAYGATAAAPILAGAANPFMTGAKGILGTTSKIPYLGKLATMPIAQSALGFGLYEGTRQAAGGQFDNILPAVGQGALSGALFHGGAKLGSTSAQPLRKLVGQNVSNRLGSAAGAGGVSALMAPEGERISSGLVGGAFGAKYPAKPLGYKPPHVLINEATNIYRDMLRPSKGEISKIEVRRGGNINDYFKLAAKEKLPIKQSADKKLDTSAARDMLYEKISTIHQGLDTILKNDTTTKFDLVEIGNKAKQKASRKIKNAKELQTAKQQINEYIDAEISKYGKRTISASELNTLKQGMWSVGYDALRPTAKENARTIGGEAKTAIENAYPDKVIRGLNEASGQYQTLNHLLESSHGRVIAGGRVGKYAAKGVGAIAGSKIPILGPIVGSQVGSKVSEFVNSPERLTTIAGRKIDAANKLQKKPIFSRQKPQPEIPAGRNIPVRGGQGLPYQQRPGLPSPRNVPFQQTGVRTTAPRPIITPSQQGQGVVQGQSPYPKLPSPQTVSPDPWIYGKWFKARR